MTSHMDALAELSDSEPEEEEGPCQSKDEEVKDDGQTQEPEAKKAKPGFSNDYFRSLVLGGQTSDDADREPVKSVVEEECTVGYADLLKAGLRKDELKGNGKGRRGKGRGRSFAKMTVNHSKENWNWGCGDGSLAVLPRGGRGTGGGSRGTAPAGEEDEEDAERIRPRNPRAGLGA
eukprot:TRINITY_DN83490_c0_g1_i1.p1 TRINITY_DN83490_c0_g1~~TRINITY_DN83490_c0_g1_i1.p1  ORF type:complete len:185 (+),score=46.53 TRINITY_DN83490_c0_g1_i1:30-557(+)